MAQKWSNNGISTLSAGIGSNDTTIFIQASHGSRFPTITGADWCYCTLEDASGNIEIVKATAHAAASTSFTVTRGQQSTTKRAYNIGDLFELRMTAGEAAQWETDIDNLEATRALKAGDTYTGTHNFTGATAVTLPAATTIGSISQTELGYLDGVTSSIQTQLNARGLKAGETWTGAHSFSGASGVTLPAATTIGPVSAAEIAALDGVTSAIQTQLDAKADLAGEIYSGSHDFSGATVTVDTLPLSANDGRAASTAYVTQAAFASYANLPANPGDGIARTLDTLAGVVSWGAKSNDLAAYAAGII